ncbi:TCPE [Enterospora canceri]|uniref:TCPE n=1 Tax=Enterospora canceri TaxID=1081671 RepID=A0A1Y1S5V0_9MICR|nr:TCPE [Enterospora canceri]
MKNETEMSHGTRMISDEFGLSFGIQAEEVDATGLGCVEANARALQKMARMLRSSLGPNGMDKLIVSCDGIITMTNDGATIVDEYVARNSGCLMELVRGLSRSQDDEVGDGTTSIILFANALLQEALRLLRMEMHPVRVAEGFSSVLNYVEEEMGGLSQQIGTERRRFSLAAVNSALSSKIASVYGGMGAVCVDAVEAVADSGRNDVDLTRVNVKMVRGGSINQTELISGVLVEKEAVAEDVLLSRVAKKGELRLCLLACPFEPPRLKTKSSLLVTNADEYRKLGEYERGVFREMIQKVKESGADLVLCQWGFDDEATSMLVEAEMPAVRWVGGHELGHIAALSGGRIVSRFDSLEPASLGSARISLKNIGTENEKWICVQKEGSKIATILVRSSNRILSEEVERSIRDGLCAARNIVVADAVVYGGGSLELSLYRKMNQFDSGKEDHILKLMKAEDVSCFRAFSRALLEIPLVLAQNAGQEAECVEKLLNSGNDHWIGVSREMGKAFGDMKAEGVFESIGSKKRQYRMATDFVNSILKISDVIRR